MVLAATPQSQSQCTVPEIGRGQGRGRDGGGGGGGGGGRGNGGVTPLTPPYSTTPYAPTFQAVADATTATTSPHKCSGPPRGSQVCIEIGMRRRGHCPPTPTPTTSPITGGLVRVEGCNGGVHGCSGLSGTAHTPGQLPPMDGICHGCRGGGKGVRVWVVVGGGATEAALPSTLQEIGSGVGLPVVIASGSGHISVLRWDNCRGKGWGRSRSRSRSSGGGRGGSRGWVCVKHAARQVHCTLRLFNLLQNTPDLCIQVPQLCNLTLLLGPTLTTSSSTSRSTTTAARGWGGLGASRWWLGWLLFVLNHSLRLCRGWWRWCCCGWFYSQGRGGGGRSWWRGGYGSDWEERG